jgi:mRNA-degrading endonuclease toxin of MazEF toxin-antitoxin module
MASAELRRGEIWLVSLGVAWKDEPGVSPEEGIDGESAAICRGMRAVSRSRLLRQIGRLNPETTREVEQAVATILGIDRQRLS